MEIVQEEASEELGRARPYFVLNEDGDEPIATVYLSRKYPLGERKIDQVELHEPTAADMEVNDKAGGQVEGTNRLIAKAGRIPLSTARMFRARDFLACNRALAALGVEVEVDGDADDPEG